MEVHYSLDSLPLFRNAVITIGTFDGVHKGHQKIIDSLLSEAARVNGESVLITFDPHPRKIINTAPSLQLINTLTEKIEILGTKGIDHLVVAPFTYAFAQQSAEAYIEHFLVEKFHPRSIIIGYDHRFGRGRTGNYHFLEQKKTIYHYNLIQIPKHVLDEIAVSSTKIRDALTGSSVETANKLLGYSFFFEGLVETGDAIGRTIGYPTANLAYTSEDKIRLGHGVYAVQVRVADELKKGMLSIGIRPTLSHSTEKTEVHIFDFNGDLYGKEMTVIVKNFLRPQVKFGSLDALKEQLFDDKEQALSVLSH